MLKHNEKGVLDPLVIPFVVVAILAVGLTAFSVWAFTNYSKQKNNVDTIVATEVNDAKKQQEAKLRAEFAEESKNPNKTYVSPQTLGSVRIVYPKTWSAYVEEQETRSVKLDGYFHPDYVPDTKGDVRFALRVETSDSDYARELESYQSDVEKRTLKARTITISGAKGTRLDGEIDNDIQGAVILLPLRDKTLKIWTESKKYMDDFNRTVKNLKYSP